MKTITLQIGNSDDTLTQEEWSAFHAVIDAAVNRAAKQVYFAGSAPAAAAKQNACWVFDLEEDAPLRRLVTRIRETHHQESVAWTEGSTVFI